MKRKLKPLAIVTIVALIMCVCGGALYAMPKTSVTNNFEMGIVDIELNEYQNIAGVEDYYDGSHAVNVLPLTKISTIPRIRCEGNDCYVRAKITFLNMEYLSDKDLYGITTDWVKAADGYWYYKNVLRTGETVDLFQGLQLPVNFPQSEEEKRFFVNIDAEAVQSTNFKPDYQSESPWGDIDIQYCGKEGTYDIASLKNDADNNFEIEYVGETDSLIRNSEDFFTNLPFFMPGDTHSDVAVIRNDSKKQINLYFYTEDVSETDTDLLDKIQLTITYKGTSGEKEIYTGPLRAKEAEDAILLSEIMPGEEGNFCFSIHVPEELDNEYSILKDKVKWVFFAEYEDAARTIVDIIKTGDTAKLGLYLLVGGILVIIGVFFASDKKKKKEV